MSAYIGGRSPFTQPVAVSVFRGHAEAGSKPRPMI
jgi:hypothetical protein